MGKKDLISKLVAKRGTTNRYCDSLDDCLVKGITRNLFENDLAGGNGSELKERSKAPAKFKSVGSSCALAVNSFAFWKKQGKINGLQLLGHKNFTELKFEGKVPNGFRGANPNLDVMIKGGDVRIGIESKFLEPISGKKQSFSEVYKLIKGNDSRRNTKWYEVMDGINRKKYHFSHLDAAQLIKHAYGLCYNNQNSNSNCNGSRDKNILLYVYWKPRQTMAVYQTHDRELEIFKNLVKGDKFLDFKAMTYDELWRQWRNLQVDGIADHCSRLEEWYGI